MRNHGSKFRKKKNGEFCLFEFINLCLLKSVVILDESFFCVDSHEGQRVWGGGIVKYR